MKINKNSEIKEIEVTMEGVNEMRKKVLIGPDDGSKNIIMRYFIISPGGYTPRHNHNYEHLVKIEREGVLWLMEMATRLRYQRDIVSL